MCPACGATAETQRFAAREMQLGTREEFAYCECAACGSVFIAEVPNDLARFYPSDYYSLEPARQRRPAWPAGRRALTRWLTRSPDPLAAAICRSLSHRRHAFYQWSRVTGVRLGDPILDFGCGSGHLLRRMQAAGFADLAGVDPYAPADVSEPGLVIRRAAAPAPGKKFRLVMMHHVLEHLPDPAAGLAAARDWLTPEGCLLVRVPVAGSFVHRRYGAHWYHLDAPRHLVVPSLAGMAALARRAGLEIRRSGFDGEEPSFLMSEAYAAGFPARQAPRPPRRVRVRHRRWAHRLNRAGQGDLSWFVLRPSGSS